MRLRDFPTIIAIRLGLFSFYRCYSSSIVNGMQEDEEDQLTEDESEKVGLKLVLWSNVLHEKRTSRRRSKTLILVEVDLERHDVSRK